MSYHAGVLDPKYILFRCFVPEEAASACRLRVERLRPHLGELYREDSMTVNGTNPST